MAKYKVTMSCGHVEDIQLFGKIEVEKKFETQIAKLYAAEKINLSKIQCPAIKNILASFTETLFWIGNRQNSAKAIIQKNNLQAAILSELAKFDAAKIKNEKKVQKMTRKEEIKKAIDEGKILICTSNSTIAKSDVETDLTGKNAKVITDDEKEFEVTYYVMEVGEIVASHIVNGNDISKNPSYPAELQPRDRANRIAMHLKTLEMVNNIRPADLMASRNLNQGAPVVNADNIVLNGNGRVMALTVAYDNGKADHYRAELIKHAAEFGFNANVISRFVRPVLIRRIAVPLAESDIKSIIQATAGGAKLGASEQAKIDATNIKTATYSHYVENDNGDLTTGENAHFVASILQDITNSNDINAYICADGKISVDGINRAKRALLAAAYSDGGLIERMTESTEDNIKQISNALVNLAPSIAILNHLISKGAAFPYKLAENISVAANKFSSLREEKMAVNDFLNAQSLFADMDYSAESKAILAIFDANKRSAKSITAIFKNVIQTITAQGSPNQTTLFADVKPLDLLAILQHSSKNLENGAMNNLFDASKFDAVETPNADNAVKIAENIDMQKINTPATVETAEEVLKMKKKAAKFEVNKIYKLDLLGTHYYFKVIKRSKKAVTLDAMEPLTEGAKQFEFDNEKSKIRPIFHNPHGNESVNILPGTLCLNAVNIFTDNAACVETIAAQDIKPAENDNQIDVAEYVISRAAFVIATQAEIDNAYNAAKVETNNQAENAASSETDFDFDAYSKIDRIENSPAKFEVGKIYLQIDNYYKTARGFKILSRTAKTVKVEYNNGNNPHFQATLKIKIVDQKTATIFPEGTEYFAPKNCYQVFATFPTKDIAKSVETVETVETPATDNAATVETVETQNAAIAENIPANDNTQDNNAVVVPVETENADNGIDIIKSGIDIVDRRVEIRFNFDCLPLAFETLEKRGLNFETSYLILLNALIFGTANVSNFKKVGKAAEKWNNASKADNYTAHSQYWTRRNFNTIAKALKVKSPIKSNFIKIAGIDKKAVNKMLESVFSATTDLQKFNTPAQEVPATNDVLNADNAVESAKIPATVENPNFEIDKFADVEKVETADTENAQEDNAAEIIVIDDETPNENEFDCGEIGGDEQFYPTPPELAKKLFALANTPEFNDDCAAKVAELQALLDDPEKNYSPIAIKSIKESIKRYSPGGEESFRFSYHLNCYASVLEPSAGTGDLLKTFKEIFDTDGMYIDCVEINPDRAAILKEKGYRVVTDDFLKFQPLTPYQLIIMNPPFKNGSKHLLHAINLLADGGDLFCILNAETIKNTFSRERQALLGILEGGEIFKIEYVQNAFSGVNVEVALIYFKKKNKIRTP